MASNILLDQAIGAWSLQSAPQAYQHTYSNRNESQLISYVGRVAYNWDSKYYVTGSIRADGSSKFGSQNAFGCFPSVSVAWRLSNESFMRNLSWLNELKINAGWGITGIRIISIRIQSSTYMETLDLITTLLQDYGLQNTDRLKMETNIFSGNKEQGEISGLTLACSKSVDRSVQLF